MLDYRASRLSRRARMARGPRDIVFLSRFLRFAFFGVIGLVIFVFIFFLWISRDLPTPGKLSNPDVHDSTRILDKEGVVLYSLYKEYNRLYIPLKDIPESLREATIATEDKDFYRNPGFSIWAYGRVIKDALLYKRVTGGSTITQQLVKNVLLSPERTPTRKIKELFLALQVDRKYTKDQILELYLNNVPYGGTSVGVEAAASLYFDKHAKDLNLAESAFLAGLPQLPTYYSPYSNTDKTYIGRTKQVLKRMREDGYIDRKQEEGALKEVEKFTFPERQANLKAPHFVMYVKRELEKMFGTALVENGNLTVKTTLDYESQKKAEEIVSDEIDKLKGFSVSNGAVVGMDPKTGAIKLMVGSKNYFDTKGEGNFNAAVDALRQPGSSLKPVMYATAFEKGYTPSTLLMDVQTEFPTNVPGQDNYKPVNYDGKYKGPMQVRFTLGNSQNIPAVKMLAKVGIKPVMQKAYDMGIENWKPTTENMRNVGLSLVLGGREASLLQIVSAYSVFANEGVKKEPFAIMEVKDAKGKTLYKHKDTSGIKVLTREVAFLISHILLDNVARQPVFGPSSWLVVSGKTVAAKTGTTDAKRDNWTIGYTPSIVVGVWVGNNDNSPMNPKIASGVTGAAPIWNKIITAALKDKKNEEFSKPDTVISMEIDALGGGLPVDGQARRSEYFVKGTEPSTASPIYKKIKMSKHDSGKLASDDEISRGDYDVKEFIVFEEVDPVSTDGKNRWQDAINEWVKQNFAADKPQYYPPTEKSGYKQEGNNEEKKEDNPSPTPSPTVTVTPTP